MKYFGLLFLTIFSMMSCGDDDNTSGAAINIKLSYGGSPLVMFQELSYPVTGSTFEMSRISFFMSEITLTGSSATHTIEDQYIDLTASHANLEAAQNGFRINLNEVKDQTISGISFNLGLSASKNATMPEDHLSSSVLSKSGEYWPSWSSYVFAKIEGRIDTDGNGITESFALHLGSDEAMRQLSFSTLGNDNTIDLNIDVKEIFDGNNAHYPLEQIPIIHSLSQLPQINQLMDNLANSITVQ